MGILTVRSYDMELLNGLLDEIGGDDDGVEFVVSGNFAKKKLTPWEGKGLIISIVI